MRKTRKQLMQLKQLKELKRRARFMLLCFILVSVAVGCFYMGVEAWVEPVHPPFRGYRQWIFDFAYGIFGPRGVPMALWAITIFLIMLFITAWRKK